MGSHILEQGRPRIQKGKSILAALSDYVVIDIETTGLDPRWDSIIELAAIRVRDGLIVDCFESLVNPCMELDIFISELTGITDKMLTDAPKINYVLPKFIDFLSHDIIVGHNVNFDINFIYDKCANLMQHEFVNDFVDAMRISRLLYKSERHHRLIDVTARLNIADTVEHRALSDSINVYRCYEAMKQYATDNQVIISNLNKPASAREIKANVTTINQDTPIYGKSFTFTGTLEKMMRNDAMQKVVNMGGICADSVTQRTNYLVLGNNDYCKTIKDGKSSKQKKLKDLNCLDLI